MTDSRQQSLFRQQTAMSFNTAMLFRKRFFFDAFELVEGACVPSKQNGYQMMICTRRDLFLIFWRIFRHIVEIHCTDGQVFLVNENLSKKTCSCVLGSRDDLIPNLPHSHFRTTETVENKLQNSPICFNTATVSKTPQSVPGSMKPKHATLRIALPVHAN